MIVDGDVGAGLSAPQATGTPNAFGAARDERRSAEEGTIVHGRLKQLFDHFAFDEKVGPAQLQHRATRVLQRGGVRHNSARQ